MRGIDRKLFDAVEQGNLDRVQRCLNKGANVLARNSHHTVLHSAVSGNNEEVIKLVLNKIEETQSQCIDAKDIEGNTPLMWAAECGHVNAAEVLLYNGASTEVKNNDGMTALHWAAVKNRWEVAKLLIVKEANIHAIDNNGKTPLDIAREEGHRRIVGCLTFRIAEIFSKRGKYNEALQAYREVLSIQGEELDPDHSDILTTQNNIAETLNKQGKYEEASRIFRHVFDRRKGILGPDHPKTLTTHNNMAVVLYNQGKHSEALHIYQEILEKQRDILGPDHPDTLRTHNNMAVVLSNQGKYSEALQIYQEVLKKRGDADHPDTLRTRNNMAVVLYNQGKYSEALHIYQEVFEKERDILGPDHPDTLRTGRNMEIVSRKRESRYSIQFHQEQEGAHLHLSEFVSNNFQNASIRSIKQGLYLPSFKARNVKVDGKCTVITRGLSQALLSQSDKSFLSNLETSAEIYERIAQGKQISKREEKEVFAFSKLFDDFEQQLNSVTNSLPSSLIHTQGYKTLGDLSNYIAGIKGDFATHLVTSNHVVAIYRTGDNYAYFDSNIAFVSGLKSADQLIEVVEKMVEYAGYKVEEKGFLVEHFNVEQANKLLSSGDRQVLTKEIKTERQLLAEQDKEFGLIKINGQEVSRVQLYNFGTKINVEGSVALLINADMNLDSKSFSDYLSAGKISMTAREYLENLKNSKNVEEVVQATKVIPFIGSVREVKEAEQIRKPLLEQLVKGTINYILTTASLSRSESQLPGKAGNEPQTYLSDPIVDNQLQKSPGH